MNRTPFFQKHVSLRVRHASWRTWQSIIILTSFLANTFGPMPVARAGEFRLPAPGVMIHLSPPLDPPILKGIKVHSDNPFRFDFILDQGDSVIARSEATKQSQLKTEATKLIKYFLASLTIPEKDLWVNLSPYEKDRIIPQSFGLTEMGRDLLAEDYMLKQITASLIYPEDEVGKKFWKRIYEESAKKFGTTNIPVNTFNKVWIVPEKAVVYENAKAGTAYVVEARLKVMLEQDYLALSHSVIASEAKQSFFMDKKIATLPTVARNDVNALGSQIVREVVIPELTKEVNENKNFSQLRQVYNSLILATWYKKKIKDSILAQVYADKNKTAGVQYTSTVIPAKVGIQFKNDVEGLYKEYLKAFKKGVYNYIKEEQDPMTQETIPRKYFSGGETFLGLSDLAQIVNERTADSAMKSKLVNNLDLVLVAASLTAFSGSKNQAMMTNLFLHRAMVLFTNKIQPDPLPTGHPEDLRLFYARKTTPKYDPGSPAKNIYPVDSKLFSETVVPILRERSLHPFSQSLPVLDESYTNDRLERLHKMVLKNLPRILSKDFPDKKITFDSDGYTYSSGAMSDYFNQSIQKFDFRFGGIQAENQNIDLNLGWKFHLNVKPENVFKVAQFLIKNGYIHKYLQSEELQNGKIFTVYIGSFSLARKLAWDISNGLGPLLVRPVNHQEIEFAPGVIGRFTVSDKPLKLGFINYGSRGIQYIKSDLNVAFKEEDWEFHHVWQGETDPEKVRDQAARRAVEELVKRYGDYFMNGFWLTEAQDDLNKSAEIKIKLLVEKINFTNPSAPYIEPWYKQIKVLGNLLSESNFEEINLRRAMARILLRRLEEDYGKMPSFLQTAVKDKKSEALRIFPDLNAAMTNSVTSMGTLEKEQYGILTITKSQLEKNQYIEVIWDDGGSSLNLKVDENDPGHLDVYDIRFHNGVSERYVHFSKPLFSGQSLAITWTERDGYMSRVVRNNKSLVIEGKLMDENLRIVNERDKIRIVGYPNSKSQTEVLKVGQDTNTDPLKTALDYVDSRKAWPKGFRGIIERYYDPSTKKFNTFKISSWLMNRGWQENDFQEANSMFERLGVGLKVRYLHVYEEDEAMVVKGAKNTGGIDLTANKTHLEIQNAGEGIKFHMDPAMLTQLQNAPGFSPEVISVQPLKDLPSFLEGH